jgi:predicted nuclease of predicted toxin-antitoxin system
VRFLIDQDIDVAVTRMLRRRQHEAWSASALGLAAAADDDLSVWASVHRAAVVSTDVEFGQRRMRNAIGAHIWLACWDWEAVDLLGGSLDDVMPLLVARADITVRISADGLRDSSDWA